MGLDVVTIGDSVVDLVIQVPSFPTSNEETVQSQGIQHQLGGSSNFLIMSSRLGLKVAVIDQIGKEDMGLFYKSKLSAEGVEVSHLLEVNGEQTAHCICLVDQQGNHCYISFPGATYNLNSANIDYELIASAKSLYISGYSLTRGSIKDATLKAIDIAKENQVRIYFDPSPRISEIAPKNARQVIENSYGLFLNEREYDILKVIHDFNPMDLCDIMVLKQGENGCTVFTQKIVKHYPGNQVDVVDTTGAGDVFNSGFIFGQLHKWPLDKCAKFSNYLAGEKVKKLGGGLNVPSRECARKILESI